MLRLFLQLLTLSTLAAMAEMSITTTEIDRDGRVLLSSSEPVEFNHAELMSRRSLQLRDCSTVVVPPCARKGNRDIVFLVDASESLSPEKFYTQFLDFVQTSWCGFDSADENRGAMITFARQVRTRIPLAKYSAAEWFDQVDIVRADDTTCCSCCTPTAEAFRAARFMLAASPAAEDTTRLVMLISDGAPWQNKGGSPFRFPRKLPASYTFQIVPQQATLLKNLNSQKDSVRLMFLGVPNKNGSPPELGYFIGSNVLGKKRCIRRGRKKQCVRIPKTSPLFPISSSPVDKYIAVSNTFDVGALIDLVGDDLCRPVSSAPSQSPTKRPSTNSPTTAAPSKAPTRSPTEKPKFEGLDLYLFLDRSKSMRWRAPNCRAAPGSNPSASDLTVCWELFLGFAQNLVNQTSNLLPLRGPGSKPPTKIGWKGDFPDIQKGLRVWIYGFACADGQSTPVVERIGERLSTWNEFKTAMDTARLIVPTGGTCPGAAFERSLGMILANDLATRPYRAALLFTDGVFYDQPRPEVAARGFARLAVMTYALGISIPRNGNNQGLTKREIKDQKQQLLAFVNGQKERFLNFGAEGYNVLGDIATSFVTQLPEDAEAQVPAVLDRPWWCGWSSAERCLQTNPEVFDSSQYCKWIPNNPAKFWGNGRCLDKDWCNWTTKATCNADSTCSWSGGRCSFKGF